MSEQEAAGYFLDEYRKGDELEVLEFFKKGFGVSRSLDHWKWKFQRSPDRPPVAVFARSFSEKNMIGQYTVMPVDISWKGQKIKACQSLDTLVDPAFRKRGIFEKSALRCFELLASQNYEFIYGFPNSNSYPGFIKKLSWKKIDTLYRWSIRLDLESGFKSKLERFGHTFFKLFRGVAWSLNIGFRFYRRMLNFLESDLLAKEEGLGFALWDEVPHEYSVFWEKVKSQHELTVWKDIDYLNWRYKKNPDRKFKYCGLMKEGELRAFSVVFPSSAGVQICEFEVLGLDTKVGRALIRSLVKHCLDHRIRVLEYVGSRDEYLVRIFAGFKGVELEDVVFCGRVFGGEKQSELAEVSKKSRAWKITFGDLDSI